MGTPSSSRCECDDVFGFLKILKSRYPDQLIVLVLDNACIHHDKMVRDFLRQEGESFHLIFLPPYSPHLDPIKRLWKWFKDAVNVMCFTKTKWILTEPLSGLWNT
ncbi:transposase [Geobacillus sp. Geo 8.1]